MGYLYFSIVPHLNAKMRPSRPSWRGPLSNTLRPGEGRSEGRGEERGLEVERGLEGGRGGRGGGAAAASPRRNRSWRGRRRRS